MGSTLSCNKGSFILLMHLICICLLFFLAEPTSGKDRDQAHVPATVHQAVFYLDGKYSESKKNEMKSLNENDFVRFAFSGDDDSMAMRYINEWNLWSAGPINTYFNRNNISHPFDMAEIIFRSFHRYINQQPMHIRQQIEDIQINWEKVRNLPDNGQ
ncbi:MAG: hypothetical protein LAT67_09795 [Balneolales bacterium]|nr:hypothetical protein [Balneolales bacterium]